MATMSQAESRHHYSWWWDSHISPKSSKWLQDNLTDMDIKVKAMLKLIEEDADSFAQRAEMYYEKRPELIKLVEEFYRGYRALAERLDKPNGELCQAHRFDDVLSNTSPFVYSENSNTSPFVLSENFPFFSSHNEEDSHTPDIPHPWHPLFEHDTVQKDAVVNIVPSQVIRRKGTHSDEWNPFEENKGLKQLYELIRIGDGEDDTKFTEEKVSRSWNVHERQKKFGYKGKHWFEGKEKHVCKAESLQDNLSLRDDVSQVSIDDLSIFATIAPEPESTPEAELKYQNLQEAFSELQVEKEMAFRMYQDCLEKITNLENQIICAKEESKTLKGEIHTGLTKLNNAEERYHLIENKYLTFQCEMEILLYNLQFQSEEEKNNLQLELEYSNKVLNDMDIIKKNLEDEIHQIKEENIRLKERNISSSLLIENLNHEVLSLKENKIHLEEELLLLTEEKEFLQLELNCVKEELESLHGLKEDVTETVRILGLNADSVSLAVKDLQDENIELKETRHKLLQKNALQEISLFEMDGHCVELRGNLRDLDGCNQTLVHENSLLIAENGTLVSTLQNLMSNMDKLLQDRISLETSLVAIGIHCEEMRENLLAKEHYCQLLLNEKCNLLDEKCNLLNENHVLVSQAESVTHCLIDVEEEKTLTLQQVDTRKAFTKLEHEVYEEAPANSKTSAAKIGNQLVLLREDQLIKRELDEVKDRVVNGDVGALILECVIHDLRERNVSLLAEIQTQSKELAYAKALLSEMNNENRSNQAKIKALLPKEEKTKMESNHLVTLLKVDGTDSTGGINEFGHLIQKVFKKVQNMQISLMDAKDEIDEKTIENLIYITFLDQLRLQLLYLNKETSNVEDKICTILTEMLARENITLVFKNSLFEKSMENDSLKANLDRVSRAYSDLEKVIGLMNKRMQINLAEFLEKLDEDNKKIRSLEDELKGVRSIGQKTKQQVQEISKLLEYNHHKRNREVEFLHQEKEKLGAEVSILHKEIEEFRINEQHLTSQLAKREQDAEQWDSEAATFYFDLQNSAVQATLFQEKVRDLARECGNLKQYSFTLRRMLDEERQSHNACVEGMKKELTEVHDENTELRSELEAYLQLVLSVRNDITSLLEQSLSASEIEAMENKEIQLAHESISNKFKKCNNAASFGIVELRNLKPKIKAIEMMLKDLKDFHTNEVFNSNSPLKSKWGLSIKDIPLDPVSNNSFSENTERFSCGSLSRRSMDAIHGYCGKSELVRSLSRKQPEKCSAADKMKVSSKSSIFEEYTRLMERLNYDDERLMDLQTNIGNLKRRMEKSSKKNDPTGFEYNTVEEHLKEVELTVLGLIERTRRWMKRAKDLSSDLNLKTKGSEEARTLLRRQLSARVRRGYETIGKLEMEVERIEFVLLKLDGDHGERIIKGKNIRTALSDYLYGRKEISRRRRYAGYAKPVANFC